LYTLTNIRYRFTRTCIALPLQYEDPVYFHWSPHQECGSARMAASSDAMAGSPSLNAAAGAAAGSIVLTVLFPIDLSKTIMQARNASALDTAKYLAGSEAPVRRLYRGMGPAVLEVAANRSLLFGIGSLAKSHVPASWPEPLRDASAGASAALIKTAVLHPLDTVKCRMQLQATPLLEALPAWRHVHQLYAGLSPAVVRSSAGMAVWLTSRNHLERTLPEEGRFWALARHFVAGALSSALTDLCTFPFDTLKKSMQARERAVVSETLLEEIAAFRKEGGALRFYRGYLARVVMVSVNGALFNAAFVCSKRLFAPFLSDA
jgi:hypothetical protein